MNAVPDNQDREISRRGIMLVLSSPSGAGKTTLTRESAAKRRERLALGFCDHTRTAAERD